MSSNKNLLDRLLKKSPYVRATFIVGIAAILLIAGFSTLNPSVATDDRKPIKVDATSEGVFTLLQTSTIEGHNLRSRYTATPFTITGQGLNGPIINHQVLLAEPVAPTYLFWVVSISSCTGCVEGHTGTLFWRHYFEGKNVAGAASWTGTWEIIKGTGDLEGARGGGSSDGEVISGILTTIFKGKIYFDNSND